MTTITNSSKTATIIITMAVVATAITTITATTIIVVIIIIANKITTITVTITSSSRTAMASKTVNKMTSMAIMIVKRIHFVVKILITQPIIMFLPSYHQAIHILMRRVDHR
ncbi:hypothetical protein BJV82DRAFT_586727 [Fennellomyces sp. T-0311]|nr:hypothetical protein BJV82DRAFT_586727 [Fennellomyces sp. T-0311]